ncbi:hypothetical protein CH298_27070 [Rhodococcoides fascians]|uniref:type ISP restriction/modification enzyme n=1 Tax=Rhodococcoides fascians TaxID=1828 RepID=UPI000B9B20F8|nr:type ISP restriction/modification enzyme [Rhodococcus fascians]OZE81419.1 hypothetical protein CH303_27610 [Rhodococcus fascians]OZF10243.1 hypothetical protein CH298_27070 [Rhodococcus fascians]OZF13333.1 hypothetical protein CH297_27360 [Rhodococcus fascians]OZF59431.1 hypothetical protein CH308_27810 [Rhodococcus fascians]OZF60546.1 hypothetical protein CH307_27995 [Rhodococcus fascians]
MEATVGAQWLTETVATFGATCKSKLAGPGEEEAAIRAPLENLLAAAGTELGLTVVPHDEVRDTDRGVRPDYAISVAGAITGYLEVKKPGANLDPSSFTGHNLRQWERQRDLPNLIYTNGTEWRLYRDGVADRDPVHLGGGPLKTAGRKLTPSPHLETLLTDFLRWKPAPITSVVALVRAIAPLTRLLRGEVLDQLSIEQRAIKAGAPKHEQPFLGLAKDWRSLLFPTADDSTFADGYAQTVSFALLLARTEGIELTEAGGLHNVGAKLSGQHSLMARALQLLTDYVAEDFKVTLHLLIRVIGAVDWPAVRAGKRDTYLHLYEKFLEDYDPALRKKSGSYYTPHEVVEQMVRLTDEVLVTRLGKKTGFADEDVSTVDPAMGTGSYVHAIIEHVADQVAERDGQGAVAGAVTDLASRLFGFELQMGPFAVAELRTTDLLADLGAALPERGLGLYVTDTLDDPHAEQTQLGSGLELISRSRSRAARVKAKKKITVVIGNPPYRERAEGMGGWVESGSAKHADHYRPLDDFRAAGNGLTEYVLKNLYVYFWRWATWKIANANASEPDGDTGVICYITTSGYLRGPGFKGMREFLRRTTSEGWIIDVSPEGMQPDVPTRIFPGVQQPLAIAVFVRKPDCDNSVPAKIRYTAVTGKRNEKYAALKELTLDSDQWRPVRTDWQAPLTPAADSDWDDYPALSSVFPWVAPGVKANRSWVYSPDEAILEQRWARLHDEPNIEKRAALFKNSRDSALDKAKDPLPGVDTEQATSAPLDRAPRMKPTLVRVGFRSFDRQWLIADSRAIDRPRPSLWSARTPGQVFVIEQHAQAISDGPGVLFSDLIPDMHHFNNRGGRVLPLLHPGGRPNLPPGLTDALTGIAGHQVTAHDVAAYVAGIVAHPGFTERFADELTTPGIRIPITTSALLFQREVELGRSVIWLHTYGSTFADEAEGRPAGDIRLPAGNPDRVTNQEAITDMPDSITYDPETSTVRIGSTGIFGPVPEQVWSYTVGGKNVLRSWFNYRKRVPGGRRSSPLDDLHPTSWPSGWTSELIDLLTVLTRVVALHGEQKQLLDAVLTGAIASSADLAALGVSWPTGNTSTLRKPDFSAPAIPESVSTQLGFDFT